MLTELEYFPIRWCMIEVLKSVHLKGINQSAFNP